MKRTSVALSALVPLFALTWGYLAVAQTTTLTRPEIYGQLAELNPLQNKRTRLAGRENELNRESQRLVREYSRTEDESKRRELEAELRKTVDDHFSIKQRLRTEELADLEAKIKKLRSRHQRREDARGRIVQDRVEQLLREADGLGWGSGGGPSGWSSFGLTGPVVPEVFFENLRATTGSTGEQNESARTRAERARGLRPPAEPRDPRP